MVTRFSLNSANVLHRNQDVHLLEQFLEMSLVFLEKAISLHIFRSDDFDLDNVIDEFHATVLPCSLKRRGQGTP